MRTVLLEPYLRVLGVKETDKTPLNPLRHLPVRLNPFSSELLSKRCPLVVINANCTCAILLMCHIRLF